jgi:hypothetical protein
MTGLERVVVSRTWVLVQNTEQVELAVSLRGAAPGVSYSYLATMPDAHFALLERGLHSRSVHEFASDEERNGIATQLVGKIRRGTENLDRHLHFVVPDLPAGFRPFNAIEYDTKRLADSIAFTVAELAEFSRVESPERLLYWGRPPTPTFHTDDPKLFSLHPSSEVSAASLVLDGENLWKRLGVPAECLSDPVPTAPGKPKLQQGWRARVRELLNPNRVEAVGEVRSGNGGTVFRARGPRILVVGKSDNTRPFIEYALAGQKAQIDWWIHYRHDPVRLPTLRLVALGGGTREVAKVAGLISEMTEPFTPDDFWSCTETERPLRDIVHSRLSGFWRLRVPELLTLYARSLRYFKKRRPFAVIAGTANLERTQVIFQAARAFGVPLASLQHGGGYGYVLNEALVFPELRADVFASYGPEAGTSLEAFASTRGLAAKAVGLGWRRGSMLANQVRTGDADGRAESQVTGRRVIYVPTGLLGDRRCGPAHDMHDTEYCLEQVKVIEAVAGLENVDLLVKLHPKDLVPSPIRRWVEQRENPRIAVASKGKLDRLLSNADPVVIDYPTTTLIESMAVGVPIVYLDLGIFRWTPEGEALMRESTHWVDRTPGWESRLTRAVSEALDSSATDPGANPFLAAYASLEFRPELLWETLAMTRSGRATLLEPQDRELARPAAKEGPCTGQAGSNLHKQ